MGTGQLISIVAVLGMFASGCSSGDAETAELAADLVESSTTTPPDTTAAPETTATPTTKEATTTTSATTTTEVATTAAPETSDQPSAELPETTITATLANGYTFQGGTPDPELLPAPEGSVTAMWYRAGDVYAVVYEGLDPAVDACPGNSALTQSGFEFVSNAALPNGACPDFPTLIDTTATQGVQICGDLVSYLTLIPSDTVAQVFASVEKPDPTVVGTGITAPALIDDPTIVPEVDPALLSC